MEVDDAAVPASSVSLGVKELTAGTESGNNGVAPRKNSTRVQKPTDNGEMAVDGSDDGKERAQQTNSAKRNSTSTVESESLKLRLTDEDLSDIEAFDSSDEGMMLKRKRLKLRRSGSKECLLGFDEESGEAELVKNDGQIDIPEDDSPTSSPVAKRLKKSPASGKSSPKEQQTKNNVPVKSETQTRSSGNKAAKTHVVGDNDDIAEPQRKSSQSQSSNNNASSKKSSSSSSSSSSKANNFKKPFEYGWKRELVWRTNSESNREKADVYFIAPNGKKLRSRNEIIPLLEGDLTIDNFSFIREPLNVSSEYESIRFAKPSGRTSVTAATLAAATTPPSMGKRISKPKGPKGASPPPEGWTPTRALKVNNAALQSSSGGAGSGSSNKHNSSTNAHHTTPTRHHSSSTHGSKEGGNAKHNSNSSSGAGGNSRNKKHTSTSSSAETTKSSKSQGSASSSSTHEPCTYNCPQANGKMPQLQCTKCLCLYHNECVGVNPSEESGSGSDAAGYVCEACNPKPTAAKSTKTAVAVQNPIASAQKVSHSTRSSRTESSKAQQSIAVVKGKKYVMVSKPNAVPVASPQSNDIENDLRQIKEGIQHTHHKTSTASNLDPATAAAVERSNKLFAANLFANVSYAYDALVCILKYLKIHERSRAASVCKLWHLAAKDTSLWQTVRMKNSKVCNWSVFAAALRRGETKHLDLRKMLVSSGRGDEMWLDFTDNIGAVSSLEAIDLCRCSSRVVECLFMSNPQLRILNAVAINDDKLNFEHIRRMTELQELRLRTCEPCLIYGDLQPLRFLTKLTHLSLTAVRGLGMRGIEVLANLTALTSLELGECGDFDFTFNDHVLPHLSNLNRLRLENGTETGCCTLSILDAVNQLDHLVQLELVNFDIKPGFDEKLRRCVSVRKLLIIPTYISQSATTNHIVLNAVQQIANRLQVFTWGVTVELLRVTALYVDQCDDSMKKKKHHFDECIPVLKPVPGATPAEDEDSSNSTSTQQSPSDVPQIEILPLDKVETILGENLPNTKFTIVKVPYVATSKQQLVE